MYCWPFLGTKIPRSFYYFKYIKEIEILLQSFRRFAKHFFFDWFSQPPSSYLTVKPPNKAIAQESHKTESEDNCWGQWTINVSEHVMCSCVWVCTCWCIYVHVLYILCVLIGIITGLCLLGRLGRRLLCLFRQGWWEPWLPSWKLWLEWLGTPFITFP